MANDIETHTEADVTFRPSEGESVFDYTTNILCALHDMLAPGADLRHILESGEDITVTLCGIPKEQKEADDAANVDLKAILSDRARSFADENSEAMTALGKDTFVRYILEFFNDLTEGELMSNTEKLEAHVTQKRNMRDLVDGFMRRA